MAELKPLSIRLTKDQIEWLDQWRGSNISRGSAVRLLISNLIDAEKQDNNAAA